MLKISGSHNMDGPLIAHIGIAVKDLEKAGARYRLLTGCDRPQIEEVPRQKVRVAIFPTSDDPDSATDSRIELVTPLSEDSPLATFLSKRGEGLHHVCIYVDNIEERLSQLKAAGVRLIDQEPQVGARGNRIAFVHPSSASGVLVELQERCRRK